jgi:hypothetical protein
MRNIINKKYLPSKKFTITTAVCIVFTIIFVLFFGSKKEKFVALGENNNLPLQNGKLTVNELTQKDSDGDGIPDWEEALWGTDKNKAVTFDGTPDAEYITNKKEALNLQADSEATATENLTETDKFAREFFSAFTAMKENGQVDSGTINNFSSALGQKIVSTPLLDKYTEADVKIDQGSDANKNKTYYFAVQKIFKADLSNGLGDELGITSDMLSSSSAGDNVIAVAKLLDIANSYKDFAVKVIALPIPESLMQTHLKIVNSANNTGIAVSNMAKIVEDPVVGLSGLSQYQKYSNDFITIAKDLEANFSKNDAGNIGSNDIINNNQ